ncbi:MAG: LuxR C-terminal-related transcriptional regulator [Gemmatimonadaceae bacterium]
MLESELFRLLEHTADAAYSITEGGEICSWNAGAERLFGYAAGDVVGRNIDEVLDARHSLGTRALAQGSNSAARSPDTAGLMPNFDLEIRTRSDGRIWVNVSTIIFENRRTGRRLFAQLSRNISQHRRNEELLNRLLEAARQLVSLAHSPSNHASVEALSEQELRILKLFAEGRSAAIIARKLSISAQTLRNHLHHINRKLRTHSRLEAVTHAQRRGLIE